MDAEQIVLAMHYCPFDHAFESAHGLPGIPSNVIYPLLY